jgi:hypothetical protein
MRSTALAGVILALGMVLSSACSHRATKVDAGSGGHPGHDAGPGGQTGTVDAAPAEGPWIGKVDIVRGIVTILMAMAGLALLAAALLDWAGYTGFSISLLWR